MNVFVPNLEFRTLRKAHIISQFSVYPDFNLNMVTPVSHTIGAVSLWQTIQFIIKSRLDIEEEFFIFCEDDHLFTNHFNTNLLKNYINEAKQLNADILLGGVSGFKTGIQISDQLFWVEKFSGLQFVVIFKKFYQKISAVNDFSLQDNADYKISELTNRKFVIHPFISIQEDFGQSDVTLLNNSRKVKKLFEEASERFDLLKIIKKYYQPKQS